MAVRVFPDPKEQGFAISMFGLSSGVANSPSLPRVVHFKLIKPSRSSRTVIGILLGGVFTQFASWHWIFWFAGIVVICIAVLSFFAIPNLPRRGQQKNGLDILGVSILISANLTCCPSSLALNRTTSFLVVAMCLFVFALTQGANNGWGQGGVIAPLVLSIAMAVAFFIREWMAKEENAAM
jgi:multisubunit Na+/H+ antiporter MnhG subunit